MAAKTKASVLKAIPYLVSLNGANLFLGLIVQATLATVFGAGPTLDALELSLAIPRTIIASLGLASLGGSALYVIARTNSPFDRRSVSALVSTVLWVQLGAGTVIAVGSYWQRSGVVAWMSGGQPLVVDLVVVALPITLLLLLTQPALDLFASSSAGGGVFGAAQVAGLVQKIAILTGLALVPVIGPLAYPGAVVFGNGLGLLVAGRSARNSGISPRLEFDARTDQFRDVWRMSLPWVMAAPFVNSATWMLIPLFVGSSPGSYSAYVFATAITNVILSIAIVPIGEAIAPSMARASADNEGQAWANGGLRVAVIVGAMLCAVVQCTAHAAVSLLLLRGKMTSESAADIGSLVSILSVAFIGQCVSLFAARYFQANLSIRKYIASQLVDPIVKVLLAYPLSASYGIEGVAVAIVGGSLASGALCWLLASHGRSHQQHVGQLAAWTAITVAIGTSIGLLVPVGPATVMEHILSILVAGSTAFLLCVGCLRLLAKEDFSMIQGILRRDTSPAG